jgi:hypothetical protein
MTLSYGRWCGQLYQQELIVEAQKHAIPNEPLNERGVGGFEQSGQACSNPSTARVEH